MNVLSFECRQKVQYDCKWYIALADLELDTRTGAQGMYTSCLADIYFNCSANCYYTVIAKFEKMENLDIDKCVQMSCVCCMDKWMCSGGLCMLYG